MNFILTVSGLMMIFYFIKDSLTAASSSSKKMFGVDADRINIEKAELLLAAAKSAQQPELYNWEDERYIELRKDIEENKNKFSEPIVIDEALIALDKIIKKNQLTTAEVISYLEEMRSQLRSL
jgi:hypothetical protein